MRRQVSSLRSLLILGLLLPSGLFAAEKAPPAQDARSASAIWGTVYTSDGESVTGAIRWGRSKDCWFDTLGGKLTTPIKLSKDKSREGITLFGWRLGAGTEEYPHLEVPFGHIESLERIDSRTLKLKVKGVPSIELQRSDQSSRDIGRNLSGVFVHSAKGDPVKIDWWTLKRVEFQSAPARGARAGMPTPKPRIFGTVTLGDTQLTGRIRWDRDERFLSETLDGEVDDDDVEIEFSDIVSIVPKLPSGSEVTLKDGSMQLVTGSNDVDSDHRGLVLIGPDGVSRTFPYAQVDRVDFHEDPTPRTFDQFDGGFRLRGSVKPKRGSTKSGLLHWDQEESYSWETLEGSTEDVRYSIPLGQIRRIEPATRGSLVTLVSGEKLSLDGTNDVGRGNRGVAVESDSGKKQLVEFSEIEWVEFTPPKKRPAS